MHREAAALRVEASQIMIDPAPSQTLGHLIRRCHQVHDASFSEELGQYDITPPQLAALSTIARRPGIELTTLSELIAYDCATAGGIIDRLAAKGLLRRVPSKEDRRKKQLVLTAEGKLLLRKVMPKARRVVDRLLARVPSAEREAFLRNLRAVAGIAEDAVDLPEEVA